MNIKTPFKCYWKHQSDIVYTVTDITKTEFLCIWFDALGREGHTKYSKSSLLSQIDKGVVVVIESEKQDPLVTISQAEYDNLIEEINMLQELITELSAPVDTAQEQQAWTYRELQKLLTNHHSFQDANGENTTHCEELCDTVLVLQSAYDRLASLPAKQDVGTSGFKSISDYTLEDWQQALDEVWVFECRNGNIIRIKETYSNGEYGIRGDDNLTRTIDGHWFAGDIDNDDIVKRIR